MNWKEPQTYPKWKGPSNKSWTTPMTCIPEWPSQVQRIFKRKLSGHCLVNLLQGYYCRNLLLGSKGIDLPKIVQKLESISNKRTFEPIQPLDNLDIENILKNEVRNKILEVFDSSYNAVSS